MAKDRNLPENEANTGEIARRADLLPHAEIADEPDAALTGGSPTGHLAGETDETLAAEDATRAALERATSDGADRWKHAGATPDEP